MAETLLIIGLGFAYTYFALKLPDPWNGVAMMAFFCTLIGMLVLA